MKYQEFKEKTSFTQEELIAFSWDDLVDDPPPDGFGIIPAPPMLMLDRVTHVEHNKNKGKIVGEKDVRMDDWFFQCHFRNDPVQPGCLGVDAIWQIIGFYISIRGGSGAGRALGAKEIEFFGQIRPHDKVIKYEVDIRRYTDLPESRSSIAIGTGTVYVDDDAIYTVKDAKVGMFKDIRYPDYPKKSKNSRGGKLNR